MRTERLLQVYLNKESLYMHKFIIVDWINNVVFHGKTFKSFDDAEEFLDEKLGESYETDRQEYFIIEKP
jgi:hypothetical protein